MGRTAFVLHSNTSLTFFVFSSQKQLLYVLILQKHRHYAPKCVHIAMRMRRMALVLYCVGIIFFGLSALAFASPTLDTLINATARFSTAIQEQLATVQKDPLSAELVEKTIAYAKAKTVYCTALREAMPELIDIAMGKYPRPVPLDKFAAVYSIVEGRQDKAADEKTFVL